MEVTTPLLDQRTHPMTEPIAAVGESRAPQPPPPPKVSEGPAPEALTVDVPANFPGAQAGSSELRVERPPPQPQPQQPWVYNPEPKGPKPSVLGNMQRACGGTCITTRQCSNGYYLGIAVLFPASVFSTSVEAPGNWWSLLITAVLTAGTLLMLLFATTCDPGILLPADPDPERKSETLIINGTAVECKVCYTCHIVRPPRSGHCHFCDNCVEEFDHHCGVLGSCVAKRTFRFFAGFMWFGTLLSAWVFVRSIVFLAVHADFDELSGTDAGRWRLVAAFGCIVYSMCGGCCLLGQGGYYCTLACRNSSQKEDLHLQRISSSSYSVSVTRNPYDQGLLRNFYHKILAPLEPSRITSDLV